MKILLTGATGMAGSEALRQCLANPGVEHVTAITRKPLAVQDKKLSVILHDNFLDYSSILNQLKGHDACLWCLGISQTEVTKEEYRVITLDYTIAAAKALLSVSPGITFGFLSGQGSDPTGKRKILFAQVKGETENRLSALPLNRLYIYRPGYIHPMVPREANSTYSWGERLVGPLYPMLFKRLPKYVINSIILARAMLYVVAHGYQKRVLENIDLRTIADEHHLA